MVVRSCKNCCKICLEFRIKMLTVCLSVTRVYCDKTVEVRIMQFSLYNTIQYKTCNAPYVTRMLFVGAGEM